MMKYKTWKFLPTSLAIAALLSGCGTSTEPASASTGNGNAGVTATKTPPSPDAGVKMEANVSADAPPKTIASSEPKTWPGDDLNRVNQLKDLKKIDLKAAGRTVHAWIMDNESKREEGMMFLTDQEVSESQGMIFVFPDIQASSNSFWMHNCPMGLDIIYISAKKKVINVGDGKPESDDQVAAKSDYRWVLELKRGWSKRHGLKSGDSISIPDSLKTKQ
jgi:uncharacterized membrane protein (UPF0127 family)